MGVEKFLSSFERLHRLDADAVALIDADAGERLSRDALMSEVDRRGAAVRSAASPRGIVALQAPNGPGLVAAVFAAWREGLIPLPIDRERQRSDLEQLGRTLGIETFLCGPEMSPVAVGGVSSEAPVAPETAVLKLTSGSTGTPRAVAVAAQALVTGVEQICSTMKIGSEDRNLATLPLAHSYGFDNILGTLALFGTPAILLSDLVPRRLAGVVRDTKPTVWPAVPLLLDVLSRSKAVDPGDLRSLRLVISAGAPLPLSVREAFAGRFQRRPRTFYGATECGGIAFDRHGDADVPEGCVGQPLDGVEVDLVDEEDGIGRIRVRSSAIASGAFPPAPGDPGAGEFHIADLGRLDAQGRLHLLGRVGDFVKVHGHKVYPGEVEGVLRSVPGVRDAIVIPYERSSVSEGLRAIVSAEPHIDRKSLVAACERVLPTFKIPRSFEIRDDLPRNERGKIDRSRL